jgi:hypothetical protein
MKIAYSDIFVALHRFICRIPRGPRILSLPAVLSPVCLSACLLLFLWMSACRSFSYMFVCLPLALLMDVCLPFFLLYVCLPTFSSSYGCLLAVLSLYKCLPAFLSLICNVCRSLSCRSLSCTYIHMSAFLSLL